VAQIEPKKMALFEPKSLALTLRNEWHYLNRVSHQMQNPANQCKRDNQKRLKGAPESAPKECIQVHFFAKLHHKKSL